MIQTFSRLAQRIGPAAQGTNFGLCCLLCLIGCTTAKANSPRSGSSEQAAPAASSGTEVTHHSRWDFEEVSGERTPVLIALPKAGHWQVDDQKTTWWVATNASLGTRLEVKLWPERRLVTWQDCLVDLGRWRDTQGMSEQSTDSNTVQSTDIRVPAGFSSHLLVHVANRSSGTTRTGTVALVGADIARCFAVWSTVQVQGASNDDELLARIALITEGILPKIRLRAVEQRVNEKVEH